MRRNSTSAPKVLLALAVLLLCWHTLSCRSNTAASSPTTPTDKTALTTVPSLDHGVPSGALLEEIDSMPNASSPKTEHFYLVDFTNKRLRFEGYVQGKLLLVGVLENGHGFASTLNEGVSHTDPESFDSFIRGDAPNSGIDFLAGSPAVKVSETSLEGTPADVYKVQFDNPSADEIVADPCPSTLQGRQEQSSPTGVSSPDRSITGR